MAGVRDWSEMPDDLLVRLAETLPSMADSVRFSATCRSFSSAARKRRRGPFIPYLLVPISGGEQCDDSCSGGGDGGGGNGTHYGFFCLSDQRVYRGLRLPEEARHGRCFSSCHGWLGMAGLDGKVRLLNPMSGAQVELPDLSTFPDVIGVMEWPPQAASKEGGGGGGDEGACRSNERRPLLYVFEWIEPDYDTPTNQIVFGYMPSGYNAVQMLDGYFFKMCMSSPDPLKDPNCFIMMIYSGMGYLAYCKPGDRKWTAVGTPSWAAFDDVTYHRGNFYAVNHEGRIMVVEGINGDGPLTVRQVAPLPPRGFRFHKYLVGLPSGELLYITRNRETHPEHPYQTVDFRLLKIDMSCSCPEWKKVNSLGESTLFLGLSASVLMSSSQASGACKGNCIYFTDDYLEGYFKAPYGGHDMGIFDMETRSIERYYPSDSQLIMPPPMWIIPDPR